MESLTDHEMRKSYLFWKRNYKYQEADEALVPFLSQRIRPTLWLKKARSALFISNGEMALRMNIARSSYWKFEKKEEMGEVTLKKMSEIAEAMGCEFIYCIRPKRGQLFSEIIWRKLSHEAVRHSWVQTRSKRSQAGALAAIANNKMQDAKFRLKQKWSQRLG